MGPESTPLDEHGGLIGTMDYTYRPLLNSLILYIYFMPVLTFLLVLGLAVAAVVIQMFVMKPREASTVSQKE